MKKCSALKKMQKYIKKTKSLAFYFFIGEQGREGEENHGTSC